MNAAQTQNKNKRRWVIKIGSALITNNGQQLAHHVLDLWVPQIANIIKENNIDIVLVSSGAVAEGIQRLNWMTRPEALHDLQAAAAVGQAGLIQSYEQRFKQFNLTTAQVLLVHGDIDARDRYLNARQTIDRLLEIGAIPIVNENDTIATDEIRFGDNDTLAGLVANLIDAEKLLILTDQNGVYNDDPRHNPDAQLLNACDVDDPILEQAAKGSGSALGRGGMATKISAAKLASRSGTITIIANGKTENIIQDLANGGKQGTWLTSSKKPLPSRKQWLASKKVFGKIMVDNGASKALLETGVSLLSVGIANATGDFKRGDLVSCLSPEGIEIARGLVNFNCDEVNAIAGKSSQEMLSTLGYASDNEVIHRNNLVVL